MWLSPDMRVNSVNLICYYLCCSSRCWRWNTSNVKKLKVNFLKQRYCFCFCCEKRRVKLLKTNTWDKVVYTRLFDRWTHQKYIYFTLNVLLTHIHSKCVIDCPSLLANLANDKWWPVAADKFTCTCTFYYCWSWMIFLFSFSSSSSLTCSSFSFTYSSFPCM